MDNIIENLRTVWDLPFVREVLLMGATAVLTHFLSLRKYKKEQHTKYEDKIGERIAEALLAVREIVLSTKDFEIYQDSLERSSADTANAIKEAVYYPAFMADKDSIFEMFEVVCEARRNYESYLDLISASYLYVFDRYLMNLLLFIGKNGFQDDMEVLGLALIIDVQKWNSSFDQHLVKQINRPHYKIFSRHGWVWELSKKYAEKKFLMNTELDKLMRISAIMKEDESDA